MYLNFHASTCMGYFPEHYLEFKRKSSFTLHKSSFQFLLIHLEKCYHSALSKEILLFTKIMFILRGKLCTDKVYL